MILRVLLIISVLLSLNLIGFSQTNNWKQYSSSMAGLSFKYPPDWKFEKEEAKRSVWRITITSPGVMDDDVFEHNSITICSKDKNDTFESLDRCAKHHLPIAQNGKESVISIEGQKLLKTETSTPFLVFYSTSDRDYQAIGSFTKFAGLDRMIPVFDQLLSTLRPITSGSVLTFSHEKFDFSLTYPTSWSSCGLDIPQKNSDVEDLLKLVPEGRTCQGGNYVLVSRMNRFSNDKNNRNLTEFLTNGFSKKTPYIEFGNIHASMGERADERYTYRERYFYTNYPQTYELLRISEMYGNDQPKFQSEASEFLKTARRFLKNQ